MPRRVPELPRELIRDTTDLMFMLDQTVAELRDFTDQLRAATDPPRPQGGTP